MVKKKTVTKAGEQLKESANRIWLAGLGALATAESEGSRLFKTLVERGEQVAESGRPAMDKLRDTAGAARGRAEVTWTQIEKTVDRTVSSALQKVGIPTRSEISQLTKRVEQLTKKLDVLQGRPARKAATSKSGARPRKTATRATSSSGRKRG